VQRLSRGQGQGSRKGKVRKGGKEKARGVRGGREEISPRQALRSIVQHR